MQWHLIIDFDGTISCEDTTDRVLQRFALPGWEDIEADWIAGRIGSRECMARQIGLLRATPEAFDAFVSELALDPGFSSLLALCRRNGIPATIVSDGLDRTIHALLRRHGVHGLPVFANRLEHLHGDRWRLSSPHAAASCVSGTCKCGVAGAVGLSSAILIGDGRSDFCLAGQAGFVLAKNSLISHCEDNAAPHLPFRDLAEATGLLTALFEAGGLFAPRKPAVRNVASQSAFTQPALNTHAVAPRVRTRAAGCQLS
ncbi:hypothetical protein GCM10019059_35420 [Camelimonas fluminis]|uniref:HAD-IB family phosphatase n=1 Tax=Camelimonas fluminis TaxID=1576911 RepID=A0ABV7UGU3_9HYPH|nr:HAD-IB family phosphatase [Camelimonas fluminis]GHE72689.1 hypothetical protein GCM10019059_35420 [Camelimonas fluminis]